MPGANRNMASSFSRYPVAHEYRISTQHVQIFADGIENITPSIPSPNFAAHNQTPHQDMQTVLNQIQLGLLQSCMHTILFIWVLWMLRVRFSQAAHDLWSRSYGG